MPTTDQELLPAWTLEDAYGSVSDERYKKELENAHKRMGELQKALVEEPQKDDIAVLMPIYEDAAESISSLISFSYCASSADISDTAASADYA